MRILFFLRDDLIILLLAQLPLYSNSSRFQIGIFFLCPLVLAVIHSIFGLKFCELLLVTMGDPRLLESVTQAGGIIVAVYGGYFLLTYLCSRRMIRERR